MQKSRLIRPSQYVEQLLIGTAKVRSILGSEVAVTDREIQDSLWHYYYDVTKTVNYILSASATTVFCEAASNSTVLDLKSTGPKKTKKKEGASKGKILKGRLTISFFLLLLPRSLPNRVDGFGD